MALARACLGVLGGAGQCLDLGHDVLWSCRAAGLSLASATGWFIVALSACSEYGAALCPVAVSFLWSSSVPSPEPSCWQSHRAHPALAP